MKKEDIKVIIEGSKIRVQTPHADMNFNAAIKKMGASWGGGSRGWILDAQNEPLVRAALKRGYGTDGSREADTCSIVMKVQRNAYRGPVIVAGRAIARAFDRDSGAKLGQSVVLMDGNIGSGGSRKNWETWANGTFLLHDVPVKTADKLINGGYDGVSDVAVFDAEIHAMAD
jgi:hypothetical protein